MPCFCQRRLLVRVVGVARVRIINGWEGVVVFGVGGNVVSLPLNERFDII